MNVEDSLFLENCVKNDVDLGKYEYSSGKTMRRDLQYLFPKKTNPLAQDSSRTILPLKN